MKQLMNRPTNSKPRMPTELYIPYAAKNFPQGTYFEPYNERILIASNLHGLESYLKIGLILPDSTRNFPEDAISLAFPKDNRVVPESVKSEKVQLYDKENLEVAVLVPSDVATNQHLNGESKKLSDISERLSDYVEMREKDSLSYPDQKYGNVQLVVLTKRSKIAQERYLPYAFRSSGRVPGFNALVINTILPPNKAGDRIRELLKHIGANFNGN